jgi:predicted glutamine amidotransferase
MCELFGMSSNMSATVRLSLRALSAHGAASGRERDGWGVGYYEGRDVRLIKDAEPAADSEWIRFLNAHDIRSPLVIAHIRRATTGETAYRNTQPFVRELAGRMHLFAHNGWLPGIFASPELRPDRFKPIGETDSEAAFCALLDRMAEVWSQSDPVPPLNARLDAVSQFAGALRPLGPANFLYSDGDALFAHGDRRLQSAEGRVDPPGLVYLEKSCGPQEAAVAAAGVSIRTDHQHVTLVASVSLTDEAWQPLDEGEVIAVRCGEPTAFHPARRPAMHGAPELRLAE